MASRGDIDKNEIAPRLCDRWPILPFDEALNKAGDFVKLKASEFTNEGKYPVVDQGEKFISGYINESELLYQGELPVIIFGDHTRIVKYINFKFAVGADGTKILKPKKEIENKFFFYFLKALSIPSLGYSRHYKILRALDIPLPPIPEQKRIVVKLDTLFAHLDQLRTCLENIPTLLKQFRQAVLTQAVTGKLTEEWRGVNSPNKFDVVKYCENLHSNKKELKLFNDYISSVEFDCHPGTNQWIRTCPGILCEKIVDGTHKTPTYIGSGVPFLSARNIKDWRIDFTDCKFISAKEHEELFKRCHPKKGSLLITKSGTIGRMVILDDEPKFSLFESVAVLTPLHESISSQFLGYAITVYLNEGGFEKHVKGTAVQHLHLNEIRTLPILLPPPEEQMEIVDKVDILFALADRIETTYENLCKKIGQLPQAILAKAFRGELVEQEAESELKQYASHVDKLSLAADT